MGPRGKPRLVAWMARDGAESLFYIGVDKKRQYLPPTQSQKDIDSEPPLWILDIERFKYLQTQYIKVPYTEDELISELLRCYENEGSTKSSILNSPETDYPTQMTYQNRFGSLTKAKEIAGIKGGHTRERVIEDIKKCYEQNDAVSIKLLDNTDDLINSSTLYSHYNSLWSATEDAQIEKENASTRSVKNKYTKSELINNLIECKEEMGDTKTKTVDEYDGPSTQAYRSHFGSIGEARGEANITPNFSTTYKSKHLEEILENVEIKDADAHIYVLELEVNDETGYYVGESKNIEKRICTHINNTRMQVWANSPHGKILAPAEKTNELNDVTVKSIKYTIPINKAENESSLNFRRRRKFKEHHQQLVVAMEEETLDVYGGF